MDKIKKKILVTGGCGFIGSHFIDLLLKKNNYFVINVDKLTYASNKKYKNIKNVNYKFFKIDICDKKKILNIINKYKPKIIVNFAAETHVDQSINSPEKFFKTNILGVVSLLQALKKLKNIRFIQISTDEVFGDPEYVTNEDSKYIPSSPYSSSKASADLIIKAWSRTYNLDYNITYSCNNYGPRQNKEKFIPTIIRKILRNEMVPIYDKGLNIREWIYVEENAKGILHVLENGKPRNCYNIGSKERMPNKKIYNFIFEKLKKKVDKKIKKKFKYVKFRPGHDKIYSISSKKIKKIGWKNTLSLERGLDKTIDWYLKNNT
jgi:dTDP-glucose 4,6-dehydratase